MFATVDTNFAPAIKLPVKYSELGSYGKRPVRLAYIKKQNNMCFYCKESLTGSPPHNILKLKVTKDLFPDNFFKHPIHLHHNHDTDMTVGAVHAVCNAILWEYQGE